MQAPENYGTGAIGLQYFVMSVVVLLQDLLSKICCIAVSFKIYKVIVVYILAHSCRFPGRKQVLLYICQVVYCYDFLFLAHDADVYTTPDSQNDESECYYVCY